MLASWASTAMSIRVVPVIIRLAVDRPLCVDTFLLTQLTSVNSFTCLGRSSPNNWLVIANDEEQRCLYSSCRSAVINSLHLWLSSLFALANRASASVDCCRRSFPVGSHNK